MSVMQRMKGDVTTDTALSTLCAVAPSIRDRVLVTSAESEFGGEDDLYRCDVTNCAPTLVLGGSADDRDPWISVDGLRIYFERDQQIFVASRTDVSAPFLTTSAVPLPQTPETSFVFDPWLTDDECAMFFDDGLDIYVATRDE